MRTSLGLCGQGLGAFGGTGQVSGAAAREQCLASGGDDQLCQQLITGNAVPPDLAIARCLEAGGQSGGCYAIQDLPEVDYGSEADSLPIGCSCPSGYSCQGMICSPSGCPAGSTFMSYSPEGQDLCLCDPGYWPSPSGTSCWSSGSTWQEGCRSSFECGDNELCTEGRCVPAVGPEDAWDIAGQTEPPPATHPAEGPPGGSSPSGGAPAPGAQAQDLPDEPPSAASSIGAAAAFVIAAGIFAFLVWR